MKRRSVSTRLHCETSQKTVSYLHTRRCENLKSHPGATLSLTAFCPHGFSAGSVTFRFLCFIHEETRTQRGKVGCC
jgi:hypothetical protein